MDRTKIEQAAREIARDAHCRYCDRLDDPHPFYDRKCRADVEDTASQIVALIQQALQETEELHGQKKRED